MKHGDFYEYVNRIANAHEGSELRRALAAFCFADTVLQQGKRAAVKQLSSWAESGNQKELAKKVGVSTQYLNDVIRGRRDLPVSLARKILKVLLS